MTRARSALALATALASLTVFAASPVRTSMVMPGVTTEEVKNAYVTWFITHGMDVAEAESNRVACTKPVQGGRGFFVQMLAGNGATPQVRLEISFGQSGADVVATGKQQLETQRQDGTVHREDFTQADVIAGTQGILDEVAASLKKAPPAAVAPSAPAPAVEAPAAPQA